MEEERIIEDEEFRENMGYGYPQESEKHNVIAFFKHLISKRYNFKSANLNNDELGMVSIPVRTNLSIAEYCKTMSPGYAVSYNAMWAFGQHFEREAQIIASTSLSRDMALVRASTTSTKESKTEIARKGSGNVKRGWFNPKQGTENM